MRSMWIHSSDRPSRFRSAARKSSSTDRSTTTKKLKASIECLILCYCICCVNSQRRSARSFRHTSPPTSRRRHSRQKRVFSRQCLWNLNSAALLSSGRVPNSSVPRKCLPATDCNRRELHDWTHTGKTVEEYFKMNIANAVRDLLLLRLSSHPLQREIELSHSINTR